MNAHDPHMPMYIGTYFTCTGKTSWAAHDAAQVKALLEGDTPPEFRTVLAVIGNADFDQMTVAEQRATRHTGPMYFDLDGATLDEAITDFRTVLGKLRGLGLDLDACRLFASGGRGFHAEIPPECFTVSGLPVEGVTGLPRTYLEIAHALYVGCIDLRVYSGKRGRMWRTPNRQRDSGAFKVAISADEALGMTPESYAELCAAPRPFLALAVPTFCAGLASLYRTARDKVNRPRKSRKQPEKLAAELNRRFKARGLPLPPSLLLLLDGKLSARDGEGWNAICVQIAICARAMGMGEDMLIKLAAPLLDRHRGDSGRYATRGQRERELCNKLAYFDGDGPYDFSAAGIKSILPKGLPCNDLEGL